MGAHTVSAEETGTLLRATGPESTLRGGRQTERGRSGVLRMRNRKWVWKCVLIGMLLAGLVGGADAVGQDAHTHIPVVAQVGVVAVSAFTLLAQDQWRRTGTTARPRGEFTEDCATSQEEGSEEGSAEVVSDEEALCESCDASSSDGEDAEADRRQGGWVGDNMHVVQRTGTRFMFMNTRRLKTGPHGQRLRSEIWQTAKDTHSSFVGLSDVGTESSKCSRGYKAIHCSSGQERRAAMREWGGDKMYWTHSEGIPGDRGTKIMPLPEGGVHQAVRSEYCARIGHGAGDSRGWGRYSRCELEGGTGWNRRVVWYQIMAPVPSNKPGSMWQRQLREMRKEMAKGVSMERTPWDQFCKDIHTEITNLMSCTKRGWAIIMTGDFNIAWGQTRGTGVWSSLEALAERCGLAHAAIHKFGRVLPWTYQSGKNETAIDHVLVSRKLVTDGCLLRMGVWQGGTVNDSDHKVIVVELDLTPYLRITDRGMRTPRPKRKWVESKLRLSDKEQLLQYQVAVVRRWEEVGLKAKLEHVHKVVANWIAGGGIWGQTDTEVQQSMDGLMSDALQQLRKAKGEVAGAGRWNANKTRRHFKYPRSDEARKTVRKIGMLQRSVRSWNSAHRSKATLKQCAKDYARYRQVHNLTLPELKWYKSKTMDYPKWKRAMTRAAQELELLKSTYGKLQRQEWAKLSRDRGTEMVRCVQKGQWRKISSQVLDKERSEVDRDILVLGEGVNRRVITQPEEVSAALDDKFKKWLTRCDDELWFIKRSDDGEIVWTHPLFARTEQGWAERKQLVEGLAIPENNAERFQEWLQRMQDDVPQEMRDSLLLFGRKYLKKQGRLIEQEDYVRRGVMKPVAPDTWDRWWAGVGGNKAADFETTSGNLFKALRAQVDMPVGPHQTRKMNPSYEQFHFFRDMINIVIETGMVYSSWGTEVVVTLPKVIGSSHLDHVRPIGLINVLRNAFMGLQFAGVQRTWDELQVLSTRQTGGRPGMGTESMRMVKNAAFETAYMYRHECVGAGNEDKKKAFDWLSYTLGYQGSLMRLAVPDSLLRVAEKITGASVAVVRFAGGYSHGFDKVPEGSCGFGTTQGGTNNGPAEYIAAEDVFNTRWEELEMGVVMRCDEQSSMFNNGESFIDDKAPVASSESEMRRWYRESGMSVSLIGGQVSGEKCSTQFAKRDAGGKIAYSHELEAVTLPVVTGTSITQVAVRMEEADVSLRCLGEWTNPALLWNAQWEEVRSIAVDLAGVFNKLARGRQKIYHVAQYVWDHILAPKVVYRLMFATISEAKFNEIMQPAWSAYKSAMHFARSTSSRLLGAMGFGNLWHRLKADRLLVLIRCLNSRNKYVKQVTVATLFLEAQWASTGEAVMGTPHCAGRGWSGTWVGDLRIWMREQGLSLSGGAKMELLREGDAFLGDEESLRSQQTEVTLGLWALDMKPGCPSQVRAVHIQWGQKGSSVGWKLGQTTSEKCSCDRTVLPK